MTKSKTTTRKKEDQLLEARQEGLRNAENSSIRPHGKLWEMDVFSWYKPNIHVLANTIHAFPFPVIWVANSSDIIEAIDNMFKELQDEFGWLYQKNLRLSC